MEKMRVVGFRVALNGVRGDGIIKQKNELFGCKNHRFDIFVLASREIAHAYYNDDDGYKGKIFCYSLGDISRFHTDDSHKLAHSHRRVEVILQKIFLLYIMKLP